MFHSALVLITLLALFATSQAVTISGFLVDNYCWYDNNGKALDTGADLTTNPEDHSVHCLIDVSVCKNGGFIIVHKENDNDDKYKVLHSFDEAANDRIIELLEQVPAGTARDNMKGYKVAITGTMDGDTFVGDADTLVGGVDLSITSAPTTSTPTSSTSAPTSSTSAPTSSTSAPTSSTSAPTSSTSAPNASSTTAPSTLSTTNTPTMSPTSGASRLGVSMGVVMSVMVGLVVM